MVGMVLGEEKGKGERDSRRPDVFSPAWSLLQRVSIRRRRSGSVAPAATATTSQLTLLQQPAVRLLAVAVVVGIASRALFLRLAHWLWEFQVPVPNADVLSWARWALVDRDGAEPYALLTLVLAQLVATGVAFVGITRAPPRWRAVIVALLLAAVAVFSYRLPPRPPLHAVAPSLRQALMVVGGSLVAALLLARSVRRSTGAPALLAALLFPICFIPTALPNANDLACVLAPALRLSYGVPPRAMYMQYDLLPSLLAVGWTKLGAAPFTFSFVCAGAYYALLLGLFVVARRMFSRPSLAGPMVIAIVLVRMYACIVDPSSVPQTTPLRLDLWPLLLAAVLAGGLRRWPVGLVLGLLCVLSRSMGTLYVGAYALALVADFVARRHAAPVMTRVALRNDLRLALRESGLSMALVALSWIVAFLLLGGLRSSGMALYGHLGVGMLRIDRTSFYWWLLPLTGAAGWLAFSRSSSLPPRRAQAALLAVALLVANSIYFFGRSHEHNLINTSVSFLFCLFLALDLAWPAAVSDPRGLRWGFYLAPYLVVAVCAYNYSDRVINKLDAQQGMMLSQRRLAGGAPPTIDCNEVRNAAGDSRVFFLSINDFWYYQQCGWKPRGYVQPMYLNILKGPLVEEMNHLLDKGVKIVVPRNPYDSCGKAWPDLLPGLSHPDVTQTPNFSVYRRRTVQARL